MNPEYIYRARLRRVVDGDTVDLEVDLGFYVIVRERFRLKSINTPEIFGRHRDEEEYLRGLKAKEFVERRFQENNGECMVVSHKTGAYGRWLGEIFFADSETSLNTELLQKGLADEYKK